MTNIATLIADMVKAGVDPDIIGRTAAALAEREPVLLPGKVDEVAERKRAADRERMRQKREVARQSSDLCDEVSPKKETSPTPPKEKTTPSRSETNVSSKTPRAALETVLDPQRAKDVVEMRQRIRKPLTTRGAELLAGQLGQWHDPNEAADAMVLNSWQGFKPEYLANRQSRGSPPYQKPKHDPFKALAQELSDEQDGSHGRSSSHRDDAQGVPLLTVAYQRR